MRPNVAPAVIVRPQSKHDACIQDLLRGQRASGGKAIIFTCNFEDLDRLALLLSVTPYSSRLNDEERDLTHRNFMEGVVDVMVATTGYGTGLDVPDVQLVIHYNGSFSLLDLQQQAGRAARRRGSAVSVLLLSADQKRRILSSQGASPDAFSLAEYVRTQTCRRYILSKYFDLVEGASCLAQGYARCDRCLEQSENSSQAITLDILSSPKPSLEPVAVGPRALSTSSLQTTVDARSGVPRSTISDAQKRPRWSTIVDSQESVVASVPAPRAPGSLLHTATPLAHAVRSDNNHSHLAMSSNIGVKQPSNSTSRFGSHTASADLYTFHSSRHIAPPFAASELDGPQEHGLFASVSSPNRFPVDSSISHVSESVYTDSPQAEGNVASDQTHLGSSHRFAPGAMPASEGISAHNTSPTPQLLYVYNATSQFKPVQSTAPTTSGIPTPNHVKQRSSIQALPLSLGPTSSSSNPSSIGSWQSAGNHQQLPVADLSRTFLTVGPHCKRLWEDTHGVCLNCWLKLEDNPTSHDWQLCSLHGLTFGHVKDVGRQIRAQKSIPRGFHVFCFLPLHSLHPKGTPFASPCAYTDFALPFVLLASEQGMYAHVFASLSIPPNLHELPVTDQASTLTRTFLGPSRYQLLELLMRLAEAREQASQQLRNP